ncbi:MAG TPA: Ig-like domain-containing protein [Longimicrobiales bacterium]
MRSVLSSQSIILFGALTLGCSDPSGSSAPARLVIDGGERRSVLIGSWEQLTVRAVAANGSDAGAVAATWSTSDTHIASIDQRGELRVASTYTACNWVTPGECTVRVIARSGDLVAEQLITVMPYTPVITVSVRQIDMEMGDSAQLHSRVLLEGRDVPWCQVSYSSQDPTIARVDATRGVITGVDEGTTFIDVNVTGPVCPPAPERVRVINRTPWHSLSIVPDVDTVVTPGATLQLVAQVRNGKGVEYPAIVVTWQSSDPSIATVENGLVRAVGCSTSPCQVTITARSGKLTATKLIVVE